MRKILFLFLFLLPFLVSAQDTLNTSSIVVTYPSEWTEAMSVDSSNFEVYSEKYGLRRRANIHTLKKYFDQTLVLSGDTLSITGADGPSQVVLTPYTQTISASGDTITVGSSEVVFRKSFAAHAMNTNYTLPADTLKKYDQVGIFSNNTLGISTNLVTLPDVSSGGETYAGRQIIVYGTGTDDDDVVVNSDADIFAQTAGSPAFAGNDTLRNGEIAVYSIQLNGAGDLIYVRQKPAGGFGLGETGGPGASLLSSSGPDTATLVTINGGVNVNEVTDSNGDIQIDWDVITTVTDLQASTSLPLVNAFNTFAIDCNANFLTYDTASISITDYVGDSYSTVYFYDINDSLMLSFPNNVIRATGDTLENLIISGNTLLTLQYDQSADIYRASTGGSAITYVTNQEITNGATGPAKMDTTYSAGNGCYVTASGLGITFTRSTATEGLISIPDGVELYRGEVHHTAAQNPGSDYYLRFNFQGTRNVNNTISDLSPPFVRVLNKTAAVFNSNMVSRTSPILYNQTSGSINLDVRVTGMNPLEINLKNYNDSRAGGSSDSEIIFIFR